MSLNLVSTPLVGKMILEVPEQAGQIPAAVLDYATEKRMLIRDHNGTIYNP